MKVIKGYKYRCYPTPHQETVLNGMMGARRVYWNLVLDMYNDIYEHNKTVEDEDKVKNYDFCTDRQSQRPNNDFYHVDKVIEYYKNKSGGERDYSWLRNYNSTIFVCVLSDLDDAMKTFFKNRNKGNKVGVPTHKKKRDSNSVRLKDANTLRFVDGHILWDENKVITAGFKQTGSIRCKLHRRFNGIIKETTFSRDIDGKWYVSFSVEEQVEDVNPPTHVDPSNVLGIDLGLKTALVTANAVDGDDNHENINKGKFEKELHDLQSKIHRIQRAMTRCIVTMTREGAESKSMTVKEMNKCEQENKHAFSGYHKNYSGGYFRLLEWKRKLESHIRRKREYDNHKLTYDIVERPDVLLIGMETLGVKEMMARDKTKKELGIKVKAENGPIRKPRRKMAKHFGDLALSDISRMLEYKTLQRGKGFCKVDRYFASSKICSHCGYKNTELTLGDRKWVCPQCGAEINRDGNAAKNIAKKALEIYNEKQSAQT